MTSRRSFGALSARYGALRPSRLRTVGVWVLLFLVAVLGAALSVLVSSPFPALLLSGAALLYGAASTSLRERRRRRVWTLEENGRLPAWVLGSSHYPEAREHLVLVGLTDFEQECARTLSGELSVDSEISLSELVAHVRTLSG